MVYVEREGDYMNRKTFIKLLSSISLLPMTGTKAFARDYKEQAVIQFSKSVALNVCDAILPAIPASEGYTPLEAVGYYGIDGNPQGYIVILGKNGRSAGYMVLDSKTDGLFSTCSLNSLSPFEQSQVTPLAKSGTDTTKLAMVTPLEFGMIRHDIIEMPGDGASSARASIPLRRSTNPFDWNDFFISINDVYGSDAGYVMGSIHPARNEFVSLSESRVTSVLNRYACSVSAMYITGMAMPLPMGSYSSLDAYKELWTLSSTTPALTPGTPTSFVQGTTSWENIGPALVSYAASQGVVITQSTKAKPSFADFKNHAAAGKLSIFSSGKLPSGAIGHSVSVQGYGNLLRKSDNKNIDVLLIADGWYDSMVYFNYIPSQFTNQAGTFFSR